MTRVRCLNKSCSLNERGTCGAVEIDLDYDGQCETADETLLEGEELEEPLADDEAADEWEEDEDDGWDDDEV